VGYTPQDWFVNAAVEIETNSGPEELLGILKKIELEMGRKRTVRLGPREIDLDILFYDDLVLKNGDLEIPHPNLHRRRFVLVPLNEIAGEFIHPIYKESVFDLLKKIVEDSSQQVEFLGKIRL
jgi:2-amino-4-hydroxy-6-hydroxymethyldihydropteridine diphosphokinase